ncbi:DUF3322 domain-containing protein [Streptomyces longwoodensis]|uniref:DUF3322 domain-containing protein n=1 Tax=Streptomyces longwoodensis TaxID=68231 RepID=UPI0033D657F4
MTTRHWTSPEDVIESLRRKWNSGRYLAAAAQGHPFEPISVPLKGPTSTDVNRHYSKALEWAQSWAAHHHPHMRIQTKTIGGHHNTPTNTIPIRIWVDTLHQLVTLLQTTAEADLFHSLHAATATTDPALTEWMAAHPMKVLKAAPHWQRLIDIVAWFRNHIAAPVYLRQIDVPDVDTKFIEAHQGILGELLDHCLPADRIHHEAPRNDLAARYGLLSKPAYVRLRHLDDPPGPYSELTVRTSELTAAPPGTHTVIVLENEITYLSLPPTPGTTALLGSGYAASLLRHLPWLADIDLWYWGDIDTHGFAILSRVRSHFPHTRSLLMDRHTLLAHRAHWGEEKNQTTEPPTHLTPREAELEQDLRLGTYQPHLRLEQERIPISSVAHALAGRTPTTATAPATLR